MKSKGLELLAPLGFDNTYALVTTKALALRYGLTKVSDLKERNDLRVVVSHEFLEREDFEEVALGYWIKRLPGGKTIEYLHYVDDILSTSDNEVEHQKFLARLAERFDVDIKPRADWCPQTRIQQDSDGNIPFHLSTGNSLTGATC